MTGKSLPVEIRYAVDTVLRRRGYAAYPANPELYAQIYMETLDEITAEVMSVIWAAD